MRRAVGACACGAPLYVDVVGRDQVAARVEWSCGHGPKRKAQGDVDG